MTTHIVLPLTARPRLLSSASQLAMLSLSSLMVRAGSKFSGSHSSSPSSGRSLRVTGAPLVDLTLCRGGGLENERGLGGPSKRVGIAVELKPS